MPCVQDIIDIMETWVPSCLAEPWDAVGLQVGKNDWPVHAVWVALDPLPEVIAAACNQQVDMLITHHPLLFKPLKNLEFSTPLGASLYQAAVSRLAVYSAHTNLDKVSGGLNDMLAERIGLDSVTTLAPEMDVDACKLVFYVPADHEQEVLSALFETPAGAIGEYSCCSFRNSGTGSFLPGREARPFIGIPGEISHVDEIRIETLVRKRDIPAILAHVRKHHPYQTMAFDAYPLLPAPGQLGFGRIGRLPEPMTMFRFAQTIKEKLGVPSVKISGDPNKMVHCAAVCSGSGSSLLKTFLASPADVFISGDLRYHDARDVESAGKTLIDIGHFPSEHLMIGPVCDFLRRRFSAASWEISVTPYQLEKDPFTVL